MHKDLFMATMNRSSDYSKIDLFQCSHVHLTIVLRKTVTLFFNAIILIACNHTFLSDLVCGVLGRACCQIE